MKRFNSYIFASSVYLKGRLLITVISLSIMFAGCATYTVTTSGADKADVQPKTKVLTSYFWGSVNKPKVGVIDTTCGTAGLESVKIKTNAGYTLLQLITLGIVHKVKVEYMCQKPAPVIGFQP